MPRPSVPLDQLLSRRRGENPVDAPMHAPAVRHAITRTRALHVKVSLNADRQSQRDRTCALLVLVCLRLSYFSSFRLGVRACASSSLSGPRAVSTGR
jgi:hypothetical protein